MKLIPEKELRELLIASNRDWKEEDLDKELERYSSYTPTFDDNYNFD